MKRIKFLVDRQTVGYGRVNAGQVISVSPVDAKSFIKQKLAVAVPEEKTEEKE